MIPLGIRRPPEPDGRGSAYTVTTTPTAFAADAGQAEPARKPCRHELPVVSWATCNCEDKHLRACELHDLCTRGANDGSVASCATCPDRETEPPPETPAPRPALRHLTCHLYPVRGNGVWRRTIDQLRQREYLFDGRRVLAVCTQTEGTRHELDGPEAVREYTAGWFTDVIEVPNIPAIGEVASWAPMRAAVLLHVGDADAVFYCHAKGVTHPDPAHPAHRWAETMFRACLDRPEQLAEQLKRFPITGAFKTVGQFLGRGRGAWHYAGTFFWVRGREYSLHRRVDPPAVWCGVEAWPGIAFPASQGGCLFLERECLTPEPYNPTDWDRTIEPKLKEWAADAAKSC